MQGAEAVQDHVSRRRGIWETWELVLEDVIDAGNDGAIAFIREHGRTKAGIDVNEQHSELFTVKEGGPCIGGEASAAERRWKQASQTERESSLSTAAERETGRSLPARHFQQLDPLSVGVAVVFALSSPDRVHPRRGGDNA